MGCSKRFHATRHSGTRSLSSIKWLVIHDTEGGPEHGPSGTADNTAAYFASESARGSAHKVIDDFECYETLPDHMIPWGAIGANTTGLHYELAARASYATVVWKRDHREMLNRAAFLVAKDCVKYGIKPKMIRKKGLRAGRPGICGHLHVSKAFPGSGHYDPGYFFPWVYFMHLVRKQVKRMRQGK